MIIVVVSLQQLTEKSVVSSQDALVISRSFFSGPTVFHF